MGDGLRYRGVLGLLLSLCACSDGASNVVEQVSQRDEQIVYGNDDRAEVYEHPDLALRKLARASVVALMPKARLQRPVTGEVRLAAPSLREAYMLCADERYLEQPVASDCSGVLIDTDLVLTAAHCFEQLDCSDYYYVFDYFYRAPGELEPLGANDIYSCQKVVAKQTSRTGRQVDYAVIQLDRPVSGRLPVDMRETPLTVGEPLSVLGTGSGLPIKIDSNARVVAPRTESGDFFALESDTFEGSSGSGVFDADQLLVGILVRGGLDYTSEVEGGCNKVNRRERAVEGALQDGDLGHEEATYVSHAVERLCAQSFPSPAICGIETRCGDGYCSSAESRLDCPVDCDPCDAGVCGARADARFAAGDSVKQVARPRADGTGSCALGTRSGSAGWLWALGVLALARRRSVASRSRARVDVDSRC